MHLLLLLLYLKYDEFVDVTDDADAVFIISLLEDSQPILSDVM